MAQHRDLNRKDDDVLQFSRRDVPPRHSIELSKKSNLPSTLKPWGSVPLPVDILLLTVEDCEFLASYAFLKNPFKSYRKNLGYVYFGTVGESADEALKVALMTCCEGSSDPGGSLISVKNAVVELRPKAVFSVGCCVGLNPEVTELNVGDVVVSSKITTEGFKTPVGRNILHLIRRAADGWIPPVSSSEDNNVQVFCGGEIISGKDPVSAKLQCMSHSTEAAAFEMGGEGLFVAAHDLQIEWVIVKGISHFSNGSNSAEACWKSHACVMVASLVSYMLKDSTVFKHWPHYEEPCSVDGGFDVETCRSKLAEYYKNSGTVPTSVWSTLDPVDIHEIYTRLSWVKQEQHAAGSSQTELNHYCDLFAANKSGTFPKRILVQGQTGIGKTTFVKKLGLDWAELNLEDEKGYDEKALALKKFELLVAVNLKEVSKHQSLKDVISCSNIFAEEDKSMTDGLLKYISDNQDKVLLVFDGYDEYRCGRDSDIFKIFKGDKLRDCCVLITSRISKADDLRQSRVLKVLRAEILGFSYSDISSYMKRKLESEEDAANLFFHLDEKDLLALAKSPLLLLFLCILWKEGNLENWPKTKTDLYVQIVESVLDHNQAKHSAFASCDFSELADFQEILCDIGKVALECLFTGDHVFDYKQLPPSIFCEESSFIGLLQVTKHIGNRRPAGMVSFIHKSIQEFLSAWFITYKCVIPEGNLGPVEKHARTLEGCIALENVFKFVCGLSDQGAAKVFKHLEAVRMSDPLLDLTATVPDVEETDKPLSEVTETHRTFFRLVWNSFEEVQSKVELSRNCFDCVGGVFLDGKFPFELLQLKDSNSCRSTDWSIHFDFISKSPLDYLFRKPPSLCTLETLERLKNVNTEIPKMRDFVKRFLDCNCDSIKKYVSCGFAAILSYNSGKVRFFIRDLQLLCYNHAKVFIEAHGITAVTDLSTLRSGLFSLKFLTRLQVYDDFLDNCNAEEPLAMIRNCGKSLNSIELRNIKPAFDWMVRLLQEIPTLAEKCSWKIGSLNEGTLCIEIFGAFSSCVLTPKEAEQLASLLPHFRNTISLCLDVKHCSSSTAAKLVESITHEQLQHLVLDELSMTPHLAAALGRSLPSLTSLRFLKLKGATKQSSEEVVDVKLSFSLDKLENLYLGSFITRKNFTTFIESLQFSPNLSVLQLWKLNLHVNDVCSLLESVSRHNPKLTILVLQGTPLGDPVTSIIPYIRNLASLCQLWISQEDCSKKGWRNLMDIQQAKNKLSCLILPVLD